MQYFVQVKKRVLYLFLQIISHFILTIYLITSFYSFSLLQFFSKEILLNQFNAENLLQIQVKN